MKHLLSYFKPYLKESFLAPLFKLLEAVFELLVPMVIAGIVDQSIPHKDQGHLWLQMGLLISPILLSILILNIECKVIFIDMTLFIIRIFPNKASIFTIFCNGRLAKNFSIFIW